MHIAFLRGMNLGRRRLDNPTLCAAMSGLGLADVVAYRASGNVLFTDPLRRPETLRARIEAGLRDALGYEVPTVVRDVAEVRALAEAAPFPPEIVAQTDGRVQVMLLGDPPPPEVATAALALATPTDRLAFDGPDLLWLPQRGVSTSALDLPALTRLLGPATTVRTQGTLRGIAARAVKAQR